MNYVEWLRVRNCLKWLAIVLGVLLVIGLIVRISIAAQFGNDEAFIQHMQTDPHTKMTQSVVNGINRTTLVNAREHETVTIDDMPDGGRRIQIVEPTKHGENEHHVVIGSIGVSESRNGRMETTTINTNSPVPFAYYLAIAGFVGLIIATCLGATFARENDGHLEIALMKPVSRTRYALGVIGADLACIAAAEALTIVALMIGQAMFEVPHFDFSGMNLAFVLVALLHPFAWYAMLNAATASLKRGSGAVLGFSWPIALVIIALAKIPLGDSALGQTVHAIGWGLSRILPVTYASFRLDSQGVINQDPFGYAVQIVILAALTLVYGALAVVQWRRVEA
jgi:hypothetical protein